MVLLVLLRTFFNLSQTDVFLELLNFFFGFPFLAFEVAVLPEYIPRDSFIYQGVGILKRYCNNGLDLSSTSSASIVLLIFH